MSGTPQARSDSPSMASAAIMTMTGVISKSFLFGLNKVEVVGLPQFLEILDRRRDPEKRERGLITVSNHLSVLDDPLIWGVLPLRYLIDPSNVRFGLGAHDICFKNKYFSSFFSLGQVLPIHRLKHSPHGGPFQPSITEAIRLLSSQPFLTNPTPSSPTPPTYFTTTGLDAHRSPTSQPQNRHAWVHIFPEGMVHQQSDVDLRYFKWGAARLVLEADPPPEVVPMFLDGTQRVMPEGRGFPRFVPRVGKRVRVAFGQPVDYEAVFGDLRRRWQGLVSRERGGKDHEVEVAVTEKGTMMIDRGASGGGEMDLSDELKYGREAQEIRIEVARRLRNEVLKVRQTLGEYPESKPEFALAETWASDAAEKKKRYKSHVDGSQISQD